MKRKCPFCNEEIKHQSHIKVCAKKHGINESFKELKFKMIMYNAEIITDVFCKQYEDGYSIPELTKLYGLYYKDIELLLDRFGIEKRTIKDATTPRVVKRLKESFLQNFGVDNPSKAESIKEKKKETFTKNYGVDNIYKSREFIEWLNQHMLDKYGKKRLTNPQKISDAQQAFTKEQWDARLEKIQNTCIDKFGYDNYSKVPAQRMNVSRKAKDRWYNYTDDQKSALIAKWRCTTLISKLEMRIQNLLNELQIEYTSQKFFKKYSYDFFIEKLGIFIEVQGDFWHANPVKYKENDELPFPTGSVLAKDLWKKDEIKKELVETAGYSLVTIWESEMKCNEEELVELLIHKLENNSQNG